MSVIKFRGKSCIDGEWVYGDFLSDVREFNRTCDGSYICPHWDKLNSPIRVDKETVGQFVWQRDIHGKELYRGDIVRFTKGVRAWTDISEIKFVEEFGTFMVHLGGVGLFNINKGVIDCYGLELVGNVYDNPDMLGNS